MTLGLGVLQSYMTLHYQTLSYLEVSGSSLVEIYFAWDWKGWCICPTVKLRNAKFQAMSRKEDVDVCVTQLYRSPGPLPTRPWGVLTELVSYMYPIYVHYMYILDVLSFPFGSRHWPYWDCEVRSKSERSVSCIAPTVLWLFYNTDHNRQIYRGHIPWQIICKKIQKRKWMANLQFEL